MNYGSFETVDQLEIMDWDVDRTPFTYEPGRDGGMFVENLELLSNGNIEADLNTYLYQKNGIMYTC